MRFVTLLCLVVVAICVYADHGGERPPDVHHQREKSQDQTEPAARPVPVKKHSKKSGRHMSTGGVDKFIEKTGTKSLFSCDSRTSPDCVRCANPQYDGEGTPDVFVGDDFEDCSDNSDEENRWCTPTDANTNQCFDCQNDKKGEGVLMKFTCDRYVDCYDGSDERCERKCNTDAYPGCFKCFDPLTEGEGVFHDFVCDDIKDCHDGSDEFCFECEGRGYLDCGNNKDCYFDTGVDNVCDGVSNCFNNEDEALCFKCADGIQKVDSDWVCDGYDDCKDESDESDCFKCADGTQQMVHDWVCDDYVDCEDESDESDCFKCGDGTQLVHDWVCDDYPDCEDESDESDCDSNEVEKCHGDSGCPDETGSCNWLNWGEWSTCSTDCGAGKRSRERVCSCAGTGKCGGDSNEVEGCHGDSGCPKEADKGCGTRQEERMRIVGGDDAKQVDWPWQAQLFHKGSFFCGGTLYKNKYVISAAHCFKPSNDKASNWEVHLGKQKTYGTAIHKSDVTEIIFNGYNERTFDNDIVVMVLETPIPKTDEYVNNICLDVEKTKTFGAGSNCYITGFGLTEEDGKVASTLQEAAVPYITQKECTKTGYPENYISNKMICAGYPDIGGIDACQGDSGGPLVCTAPDDNGLTRWYLAGVTSWGSGCARTGLPGVYTDVSKYIDWLVSQTTP